MTQVLVIEQDLEQLRKITQKVSQNKGIKKTFSTASISRAESILQENQPEIVFLNPFFKKLFNKTKLINNKDFVLIVDQNKHNQINAEAIKVCSAVITTNATELEFTVLINALKMRKIRGDQSKLRVVRGKIPKLTKKELEIVQLLCAGKSDAYISKVLNIKNPTVKTHLRRIFSKMKVSNRTHCVAQVIRARILN